jgi:phosphatidylinositol alpha 1,6-mannosyltransferase
MRIVLVTDSFAPAADTAAETARHICDALLAADHDVLVLTTTKGTCSYRSAQVVRMPRNVDGPTLRRAVTAFGPDVVQVLNPRALGTTALRELDHDRLPVFVLDPLPLHPRVGTALSSSRAAAATLAMVGVEAPVWRPGVRADEHHPGLRSTELHDAWARSSSGTMRTVVGYAGPVGAVTSKHVRRLVRVAEHENLRLVVLGSGPGTHALKAAGARIAGECTGLELARAIASLDVFVQPRKGVSGLAAVRKALASGVPVVAFRTAATTEVVTSGHNGLLVGPGQGRKALRDAVARLAADPDLRAELSVNARPSVAGRTWADAMDELVGIYRPLAHAV